MSKGKGHPYIEPENQKAGKGFYQMYSVLKSQVYIPDFSILYLALILWYIYQSINGLDNPGSLRYIYLSEPVL